MTVKLSRRSILETQGFISLAFSPSTSIKANGFLRNKKVIVFALCKMTPVAPRTMNDNSTEDSVAAMTVTLMQSVQTEMAELFEQLTTRNRNNTSNSVAQALQREGVDLERGRNNNTNDRRSNESEVPA